MANYRTALWWAHLYLVSSIKQFSPFREQKTISTWHHPFNPRGKAQMREKEKQFWQHLNYLNHVVSHTLECRKKTGQGFAYQQQPQTYRPYKWNNMSFPFALDKDVMPVLNKAVSFAHLRGMISFNYALSVHIYWQSTIPFNIFRAMNMKPNAFSCLIEFEPSARCINVLDVAHKLFV